MEKGERGRVLIVEDDLLLAMVEERLIKKLGFNVVGKVREGSEAIAKVAELKPDIILMDISLKGDLDGIQTMEIIRRNSDIPVIYLSGSSDRYYYERAKKTNFIAYLKKPVSRNELNKPLLEAANYDKSVGTQQQAASLNKTA
ncbi:MAG TPA: response regulator [Balneolaceae bacterium]|nr:response regulator [Balneolaceae bacterium]